MPVVGCAFLRALGFADETVHIQDDGLQRLAGMDFVDPYTGKLSECGQIVVRRKQIAPSGWSKLRHVRRPAPEPSQILARELQAATGSASSIARNDPALYGAPKSIESRVATANPNGDTQGPAHCRCPRSSPRYSSGSNDPEAERARPCAPRSKACTSSRRSCQS